MIHNFTHKFGTEGEVRLPETPVKPPKTKDIPDVQPEDFKIDNNKALADFKKDVDFSKFKRQ